MFYILLIKKGICSKITIDIRNKYFNCQLYTFFFTRIAFYKIQNYDTLNMHLANKTYNLHHNTISSRIIRHFIHHFIFSLQNIFRNTLWTSKYFYVLLLVKIANISLIHDINSLSFFLLRGNICYKKET